MKKGIQVHVHFTDGEVLSGDRQTWQEIVDDARRQAAGATEDQIEDALNNLCELFEKLGKMETMNIVAEGHKYSINPVHVKYVKIERV